jgi:hypothetical protein
MKRRMFWPVAALVPLCTVLALAAEEASGPRPVINEIMAVNVAFRPDTQRQFDDWIEIYNAGDVPADLAGMWLSDDASEPTKWRFPAGTAALAPGDYLIVWADDDVGDTGLHAAFQLSSSGEEVYLFAADGETVVDSLSFGRQDPDVSFGRYPDAGDQLRFFPTPTPGGPNQGGYAGEVAPLHFSHERGFYDAPFDLMITTATDDADILYAIDGRVPGDTRYRVPPGQSYTGPIHIAKTTCVRAVAVKSGWKPTLLYTHTYVFDTRQTVKSLPMVSLVGDEATTFYEPDGVMAIVGGTYNGGVWASSGSGSYNNALNRGMERPVSAEWLPPDNEEQFQIDCGLRVHGSDYIRPRYVRQNGYWSGNGKFSLRLYFRGQYGENRLEYPLFPESNTEEFASVVLRAGHNDISNPFIKDELLRRLHKDMGQVAVTGTFANLFINGQYKGYYNPTEHVKEESCQQWFHSDNPWDVMTMNGIRDGDTRSWNEMLNYATSHDLSDPTYYAEMGRKLDIVCFIDYLIIRLWPNDWDWPQNNWSAACERSETGRWKFFVWDAEGTFRTSDLTLDRFGELNSQNNANGILYRALKASTSFRLLFADRLYRHFYNGGAMTEGNIRRRFTEMQEQLRGVIPSMNTYIIDTWVPNRFDVLLSACKREGMYTFEGPTFFVNGAVQHGGHIADTDLLQITSSQTGTVYYTLDGADPAGTDVPQTLDAATLVAKDALKRVTVPTRPVTGDWRSPDSFNDSPWLLSSGAPGGVGYERGTGYESHISLNVEDSMYNTNGSCYIRIPFEFNGDKTTLETMTLRMQYDDGFVAYLNSMEVARRNFEGAPAWNSVASVGVSDSAAVLFESIDISSHIDKLRSGDNILAIHGLNVSTTSSDFLINAELVVRRAVTPGDATDGQAYTGPVPLTRSAVVKARAWNGLAWSALAEAAFAVGPVAENLRISEVMYNPADPNTEFIELTNIGAEAIDLALVRFTDGIDFMFPPYRLDPGGYCVVVQDLQAFEVRYGNSVSCAGQYAGSLSNAGERIELQDAVGRTIHAFTFRDDWYDVTDEAGFSLTVRDPVTADPNTWGDPDLWRPSAAAGGSPGYDDSPDVVAAGGVVINELLANATGGVSDWIELRNTTDTVVSVGGWYLSDDADDPAKYEIAPAVTIAPEDYLVLSEDVNFGNAGDPGCHTPFALSRDGETLYLYSASNGLLTGYCDRVEFGASEPGVTFARYPLSTGTADLAFAGEPTPGTANAPPWVGSVVISEIMYHPDNPADAEYIELFNAGESEVTLYDAAAGESWRLAEDPPAGGVEIVLPADPPITLAPREYFLLVRDRLFCTERYTIPSATQILQWPEGKLDNAGETIVLSRPGRLDDQGVRHWICVDRVAFSDGAHPENFPGKVDLWPAEADGRGSSLARSSPILYGNEPGNWEAAVPSPGAPNRRGGR